MTETIKNPDRDTRESMIYKTPPKINDLEPGEKRVVQLQRNQLGPDFPRRPCAYLYRRVGNRLFANILEEVSK